MVGLVRLIQFVLRHLLASLLLVRPLCWFNLFTHSAGVITVFGGTSPSYSFFEVVRLASARYSISD